MLTGDNTDCYWRTYDIAQPIASVNFLNSLDSRDYYFPWRCNYELFTRTGKSIEELGEPTQMGDRDYELDFYFKPKQPN